MPTSRRVNISTAGELGLPLPGARAHFVLSAPDSEAGVLILTAPVTVDLDALGNGVISLWPNVLGTNGTYYVCTIYDQYNRVRLQANCVVPNVDDTSLSSCLQLVPPPPLDEALVAVQQAQAAAATAQTDATQCAADAASTAADRAAIALLVANQQNGFVWNQGVALATWTVTHNMGKYPSVSVEDSVGEEVEGEVVYDTLNTLRIIFTAGFSGRAILN